MNDTIARIRSTPTFRAAIVAPIAIMVVFSIFNMTAPLNPARVAGAITLGVVNLDGGIPGAPMRPSDAILGGLRANLPFEVAPLESADAARAALERGDISAALIVPPDFSRSVMGGGAVAVTVLNAEHLSLAETQLGAGLPGQIGAAFSAAVSGARLAMAQGGLPSGEPPVGVTVETLHPARNAQTLFAPFVMAFAVWIAGFVGGLMLFLATRGERGPAAASQVALLRTFVPVAVAGIASLLLALIVAGTTALWGDFVGLWLFAWLASAAVVLIVAGLFSVLGLAAILIALPVVFYQTAVAGAQAPPAAAPGWIAWLGDVVPAHDVVTGFRAILIGGPDSWLPVGTAFAAAAIGVALIWLGTFLHARLRPTPRPAATAA